MNDAAAALDPGAVATFEFVSFGLGRASAEAVVEHRNLAYRR